MNSRPTYEKAKEQIENLKEINDSKFILDLAGVIFIAMDTKGIVTFANKKACKVFGYKEKEILGKNWFENFLPKRIKNEVLLISKKILSGEIDSAKYYENLILTKSGEERLISWHNAQIKNNEGKIIGHLSSGEDITERKRQEIEMSKLSIAVEQSSNTIVITDLNGNIEYVNTQFIKTTGYSKDEVFGKNPRILNSGKQNQEYYKNMWKTISKGKNWHGEFHNRSKNGNTFIEHVVISPIKNNTGQIINYLAIKKDITKEKELEQKLLKIAIETEEKERRRFAKDLHDDIGPLFSTLKLYFNILTKSPNEEKKQKMLAEVNEIVDDAINIIKQISGDLSPQILEQFGLITTLKTHIFKITENSDININIKTNSENKRISTEFELNFYRITKELINNSIKHSKATNVNINVLFNKTNIEFLFSDNGIGFDFNKYKNNPNTGNGIFNIIQRTKSMKGEYTIKPSLLKGFSIKIIVPYNN